MCALKRGVTRGVKTMEWARGERFRFAQGFGITISSTEAVVITNPTGRRYVPSRVDIPRDAQSYEDQEIVFAVKLALEAVDEAL